MLCCKPRSSCRRVAGMVFFSNENNHLNLFRTWAHWKLTNCNLSPQPALLLLELLLRAHWDSPPSRSAAGVTLSFVALHDDSLPQVKLVHLLDTKLNSGYFMQFYPGQDLWFWGYLSLVSSDKGGCFYSSLGFTNLCPMTQHKNLGA